MSIKIYVKYVKNNRDFHTTKLNLPTGNLDSKNGAEVMNLLTELNREGTTIIMVTHSQHDASFAHRTIHLFDGSIVASVKA